ncbi:MAG: Flp pilus assembly protein CpaB [Alphaproteobacteria bacterium]
MRAIYGLVLALGLALAGLAVYVTRNYVSQTQARLAQVTEFNRKVGPMVEVYVVNKVRKYGDTLLPEDVQLIYWPASALPDHIFKNPANLGKTEVPLFPKDTQEPRYVLRQMEKFEPVLAEKVTEPGQIAGLAGQLGVGQGAFAIKVDVASGVSGFVQPGDFVDVYWTGAVGDNGDNMTRLIESGVKVIAVDQSTDDNNGAAMVARTVTVAAIREQVARLAQAAATGKLALSLVAENAAAVDGKIEVDSKSLLGIAEAPVEVAAQPDKVCSVKTRKGSDVQDTPIPCGN